MPFAKIGCAELGHRRSAHFREPHAQQHLIGRHAFLLAQQVDDVLLLLDIAGGHLGCLVDDVLAGDDAGDDDVLAVAVDRDRLAGEQLLQLLAQLAQIAAHDDLEALDAAGLVPDEHRDRAWRLAVDQQLARRRHHRVGDVRAGQRDARDAVPDVEQRRAPDQQLDLRGGGVAGARH